MPKLSAAAVTATFTKLMSDLLAERRACAARLAEIDGLFGRYGLALGGVQVPAGGTPPAAQAERLANLAKARAAKAAGRKPGTPPAAPEPQAPAPRPVQRHYSAASRRALAEAAKRRWAKFRAAKAAAPQPAAPPAKPAGKQRKRKTYEQTSDQFIFALLAGGKSLATADINKAWKASGRGGSANNTLTLMTQAKQLARKDNEGGRGSVYRWA
jgi:hypothetical protein